MDRLLDSERRLRRMVCPACGGVGSLQTVSRCELAYGEYLYTVRCQPCGMVFELSTETETPRFFQPDLHVWLSRRACPACKEAGAEVVFRCDVPSRPCFYLVRCRSCGHEYAEARLPASGEGREHRR
jgi:transcription elongation factor Elf1